MSLKDIPHTEEPIAGANIATQQMRAWMERVSSILGPVPDKWIVINSIDDFPVQSSTEITLQSGYIYIAGAPITTDKRFVIPSGFSGAIWGLDTSPSSLWTYTGAGDMFTGVDVVSIEIRFHAVSAPNSSKLFNISSSSPAQGSVLLDNFACLSADGSTRSVGQFGRFESLQLLSIINSGFALSVSGGLGLGGTSGLELRGQFTTLSINRFASSTASSGYIGLDFVGATFSVFEVSNIIHIGLTGPGPVGLKGDINSANIAAGVIATVRDCEFIGSWTPLEGVTSRDIRYRFTNSEPIPDSTIAARLKIEGSTLTTTMSAALTPTPINGLWTDGEVEERMCFGDKLLFDSSTNTCTTEDGAIDVNGGSAFNHGLSNGHTLQLMEKGGLPAELSEGVVYYVGNVTATTFQLFSDSGLTNLVTFTDNGTPINYYCHDQGSSQSGWVIYIAENTTDIKMEGWVSVQKSIGVASGVRAVLMVTDTSYNVTRRQNGASVDASTTILASSQITDIRRTAPGEGFIVYVENITGTQDNEITDALVSFSKA